MKKLQKSLTNTAHWLDWRATCAYDRCSAETREVFNMFALRSFRAKLPKGAPANIIIGRFSNDENHSAGEKIWKLFEGQVYTKKTKDNIPYKKLLFKKTLSSNILPEAYACTMFRDVVRDWLKNEGPSPLTLSLDESLSKNKDANDIKLEDKDLVPCRLDPSSMAAFNEFKNDFESLFNGFDFQTKAVVAAAGMDISLADSNLCNITGLKRQRHYDLLNKILSMVEQRINDYWRQKDELVKIVEYMKHVARLYLDDVAVLWAKAEKRCNSLFKVKYQDN